MFKWKGSGLESHSLQLHEPVIIAEMSQMWVVCASVVTDLAVLTCSHYCKSLMMLPGSSPLMKRLQQVHPQRWTTHGHSLRTHILSPALCLFLPRDATHTYWAPALSASHYLRHLASSRVSWWQKLFLNTQSTRGILGGGRFGRILPLPVKIIVKSARFSLLHCSWNKQRRLQAPVTQTSHHSLTLRLVPGWVLACR